MPKLFPDPDETIEGTAAALRAGRTTCAEVLERCLARIDEWEPKIRAWVVVDRDGARRRARALDEELAAGAGRGPLHGVPVGIKDIIDVAGLPTAAGFGPWRGRVAERNAGVVDRLDAAGAVILGKTVTTQFAWVDPPLTRNPWDLSRTPGGSSSGSAAAVAAGMCLGAVGTQTGGSIIRPASFCGVAGLKPAYPEVDTRGIVPFAPSLDHAGPVARTTRDLALLFHELDRRQDHRSAVETPPALYRLRGYFDRHADPPMTAALDRAVAALAEAGARVVDLSDDGFGFEEIHDAHRTIMAAEAAAGHEFRLAEHPGDYAPRIRALVEEGLAIPLTRYVRRHLEWQQRSLPRRPPVAPDGLLLTPAAPGPAPDRSTTGDPVMNAPWSYLGWPAVTFPVGLSEDGLPLGLQLVGAPPTESRRLLDLAAWCEAVIRRDAVARSD